MALIGVVYGGMLIWVGIGFFRTQFVVVFVDQVCFCHDCWCGEQTLKMDMIIPLVLKL